MLSLWTNPEFVRHRRAELRPARLFSVGAVTLVICILTALVCWSSGHSDTAGVNWPYLRETANRFYHSMVFIQLGVLAFWSLFACVQSVAGERERKTWDFQRTTRLAPAELLVGKLFGEPVLVYVIALICLPITVLAGIIGGVRLLDIVCAYTLIFSSTLFIGLAGLWLSHLFDNRSRGVGLGGSAGIFLFLSISMAFRASDFPGLAAFSPLTGLLDKEFFGDHPATAALFGRSIPWVWMSLLLYATCGAWLVLMLVRNLKKDYEDMRLLSRWQAVGCAAFLNFSIYALFHPERGAAGAYWFAIGIVMFNAVVLFAIGLATLTPPERLKAWWRERAAHRASLFDENGPPWPWPAVSAIVAYVMLTVGLHILKPVVGFERGQEGRVALQLLAVLIFVTRDILFLQWCRLTRMRDPVMKGFLFLGLYYVAAGVLTSVLTLTSQIGARVLCSVLTPLGPLMEADVYSGESAQLHFLAICTGMALQLAASGFLLRAIIAKLRRSADTLATEG
jgi:hypothetical protein